jgi:hypothetical protein
MCFCLRLFALSVTSKIRPEAGNAILRHQLLVLQGKIRGRVGFTNSDRLFFICLYRWFPPMLDGLRIIRPETLTRLCLRPTTRVHRAARLFIAHDR